MKVKIEITVDVDRDGWDQAYGTGMSAAVIREDVRSWVKAQLSDQAEGLITDVR